MAVGVYALRESWITVSGPGLKVPPSPWPLGAHWCPPGSKSDLQRERKLGRKQRGGKENLEG